MTVYGALSAFQSAFSQFPVIKSSISAFSIGTVVTTALTGYAIRPMEEKDLKGLFDGALAGLQLAAANGLSMAVVESLARSYGVEPTLLNQAIIALAGYSLALPLYGLALELPPTYTGIVLKNCARTFMSLSFIGLNDLIKEFRTPSLKAAPVPLDKVVSN